MATVKALRKAAGLTQRSFSEAYRIPLQTLKQWESDPGSTSHRVPPEYVTHMLERLVSSDFGIRLDGPQSRVEHLARAAMQTRSDASHWMRYLRKELAEDGIRLSGDDVERLLGGEQLTMFQKVSLARAVDPATPTGRYVMSLNEKAETPMVDDLRRRLGHVGE